MNIEEIIKLAQEAGLVRTGEKWLEPARWGLTEIENFAALVAAVEREKSLKLWMLLDDIDTADDIAKADDKLYRSICQKYQKKRWEVLSEQEVDTALMRTDLKMSGVQPKWVGLTKDECDGLFRAASDHIEYAYAIQAKLKEKNA